VQDRMSTVQRGAIRNTAIAILIRKAACRIQLVCSTAHNQPPRTPIGLPSELLQATPDIAAAERRVAEQTSRSASLVRRMFPTVNLDGPQDCRHAGFKLV